MLVDRALTKLQRKYPDLDIERVDIVTNPKRAWNDGVRMIPALKAGDNILTGLLLSSERVREFVEQHLK